VFVMEPGKCRFQEIYNLITAGFSPRCATCTAVGGVRYLGFTYDLPVTGATNAAGTFIIPLMLTLKEFERALRTGGTINHALLFNFEKQLYCSLLHLAGNCQRLRSVGNDTVWSALSPPIQF
jgi:hypothetical protein